MSESVKRGGASKIRRSTARAAKEPSESKKKSIKERRDVVY